MRSQHRFEFTVKFAVCVSAESSIVPTVSTRVGMNLKRYLVALDNSFSIRIAVALTVVLVWIICNAHIAFSQTDPRNPDAIELPEMGRMVGVLQELYGRSFWAVGHANRDLLNDWIVAHL